MNSRFEKFMAERAAETYPEPASDGHAFITSQMAEVVAKLLHPDATLLDVGSGQGPALDWFTAHKFYATGITTNDADFNACEKNGHDVYKMDMHAMDFSPESFDCVWARHVLEHSPIPLFVLFEFARVLKPGGILYSETPAPDTACCHEVNQNHYSVLGSRAWSVLLQRAGFTILEARTIKLTTPAGPDVYFSFIARKND